MISRDHSAPVAEPAGDRPFAVISLVGGKWTTFRGFAEEVADLVLGRLGAVRRISTREQPIGGGRDMPRSESDRAAWVAGQMAATGAEAARCRELLARYGTRAEAVLAHEGAVTGPMLPGANGVSLAELDWIVRNEWVHHLSDLVLRRLPLALTGQLSQPGLAAAAGVCAAALGWDADRAAVEIEATHAVLAARHGVKTLPE